MIKFNDIIGKNIAVHCDTEEKAKKFLQECENRGLEWIDGDSPMTNISNIWHINMEYTCYAIKNYVITYENVEYFKIVRYELIEYNDVLFED